MVLEKDLKTRVYEGVESEELIRIPSSEQDFLSLAYEVPFKIEYHNSEIIVIGLSAFVHELIITNVVSSFMNLIEDDSELTLLGSNLGVVSVGLSVSYFLPDLKIVKGKPVFVENTTSIIKNPTVVFEVMSPSTKSYD
ncbi:MAG: Uma2 family endonuclease, partial [Spirosomaceae bacterium]|nr:Uma2 family endonuclease [Spirosomataceae bacterium]